MNILYILLGQIPEAIYLAIFMIFAKGLKSKRILFTILMCVEYVALMAIFPYNWLFHIIFTITTFLTLKILYKEYSQITDVFILAIGYVTLIISSVLCVLVIKNTLVAVIVNRIVLFMLLFIFNTKLNKIQKLYKKYWNRNDSVKKMKSATFRSLNVVIFNLLFYIINIGMVVAMLVMSGR